MLAKKHLIMHGSDFDLRLLHDLCQFRPKSIFDTMLAAQLLGRARIGLAPLLEEHFGVALDKDGQKANWSQRPITPKLLNYAALDVWHLPALRDILTRELKNLAVSTGSTSNVARKSTPARPASRQPPRTTGASAAASASAARV